MKKAVKTMAVVINPYKKGARELAEKIRDTALTNKVESRIFDNYPLPQGTLQHYDLCCVTGGDGTLLGVVNDAVNTDTPVMGVNLGKLGFLATYTPDEIVSRLPHILEGDYCEDERSLIKAFEHSGVPHLALNDVAIKSTSINLMRLQVFENQQHVADYSCDGLIFATPTGSTAYNLSAGGPILHPQNNSIAMTPICPHTLSNRSFLFPDRVKLTVMCDCHTYSAGISVDGRALPGSECQFPFMIEMAAEKLKLIHDAQYSHYAMLRSKLNWV